ncbi:hypothetical protein SOPP22_17975 [Shewanella sp. OPT22]|nr:hypothetical protein SOPP22_17975 [Shewanella sp. OPT22]
MDEQLTQIGEFIPAETRDDKSEFNGEEHRTHTRMSLKESKSEDLGMACDGITTNLFKRSRFGFKRKVGLASVKDMSIGGLGFLCNTPLELGDRLHIRVVNRDLKMKVVRAVPVNSRLNFYGTKWLEEPEDKIVELMNQVQIQMKNKHKS